MPRSSPRGADVLRAVFARLVVAAGLSLLATGAAAAAELPAVAPAGLIPRG